MKYITYKSEREIKLKDLAAQYNTTVELIKKANPKANIFCPITLFGDRGEIVAYNQTLKIPIPDEAPQEQAQPLFKLEDFTPIARYRCTQQNTTKALNEVRFSSEVKNEYLLSLLKKDLTYYHIVLKDYVHLIYPQELGAFFDLAREVELVRNNVQFTQDDNEKIKIYNTDELLTNWEHCKSEIIPNMPFFKLMKEKDNDAALDFINKGDEEFMYEKELISVLKQNLFFHILWKALSNKEEPFVLQQASQIFPNMVLEVEVKRITIGEEGATKTYKLVGKLNKEKLSNEELINLYDKHYKPLLGYSFTEFEFTYSILYTVETKSNIPIDASVVILEKVKNNFELITQYKIESVEV